MNEPSPMIRLVAGRNALAIIDQHAATLSALLGRHVGRGEVAFLAAAVAEPERMAEVARATHTERRGRKPEIPRK